MLRLFQKFLLPSTTFFWVATVVGAYSVKAMEMEAVDEFTLQERWKAYYNAHPVLDNDWVARNYGSGECPCGALYSQHKYKNEIEYFEGNGGASILEDRRRSADIWKQQKIEDEILRGQYEKEQNEILKGRCLLSLQQIEAEMKTNGNLERAHLYGRSIVELLELHPLWDPHLARSFKGTGGWEFTYVPRSIGTKLLAQKTYPLLHPEETIQSYSTKPDQKFVEDFTSVWGRFAPSGSTTDPLRLKLFLNLYPREGCPVAMENSGYMRAVDALKAYEEYNKLSISDQDKLLQELQLLLIMAKNVKLQGEALRNKEEALKKDVKLQKKALNLGDKKNEKENCTVM